MGCRTVSLIILKNVLNQTNSMRKRACVLDQLLSAVNAKLSGKQPQQPPADMGRSLSKKRTKKQQHKEVLLKNEKKKWVSKNGQHFLIRNINRREHMHLYFFHCPLLLGLPLPTIINKMDDFRR